MVVERAKSSLFHRIIDAKEEEDESDGGKEGKKKLETPSPKIVSESNEWWSKDFNLFTIDAGSGRVRAACFAANYDASVAICELPFSIISFETTGGVGET
ncbi:hypothetical protein JHK85_010901 [Glycine max]|nr:hypothetical protein JHK85_010901 [Glycine max]